MDKVDKNVLQVVKEVVIKFIEVGRISPTSFAEHFDSIYNTVQETIGDKTPEDKDGA